MPAALPFSDLNRKAVSLGAPLVGTVPVDALRASPSHHRHPLAQYLCQGASVVVLALAHAERRPKMDWWDNSRGRTPGNRALMRVNRRLIKWLLKTYGAKAFDLPYAGPPNGVFLKDAAILAGLGVMGRNNLVITPQYGPRVRLRALLVDRPLTDSMPLEGFAPCQGCPAPCHAACPESAFSEGLYRRDRCQVQMERNEKYRMALRSPVVGMPTRYKVAYCRRCELACPVGV
jgi:epoxyqueuosine reductase